MLRLSSLLPLPLRPTLAVQSPPGTVEGMASPPFPPGSTPGLGAPTAGAVPSGKSRRRGTADLVVTVIAAVVLATLMRLFVAQVFVIPSASMSPTLQDADRVLVEKVSYRFSDVERGDVVVFDRPEALAGTGVEEYLIKRVVGLPGETLSAEDGVLLVDGAPLSEPWLGQGLVTDAFGPVTVPEGEYFLMGDNRGGSEDSRSFGPVPAEDMVGRALLLMWPLSRVDSL